MDHPEDLGTLDHLGTDLEFDTDDAEDYEMEVTANEFDGSDFQER